MSLIKPNETMSRLNPGYLTARNASLICSRVIAMSDNLLCHTRTAKLVGSCRAAMGSRGDMPGAGRAVFKSTRCSVCPLLQPACERPQIGRFDSFDRVLPYLLARSANGEIRFGDRSILRWCCQNNSSLV